MFCLNSNLPYLFLGGMSQEPDIYFYLALLNCVITKIVLQIYYCFKEYFTQQNNQSITIHQKRIKIEKQYLKH